jgi:photosystem II stability/assembly factor-like uncharacterized protein
MKKIHILIVGLFAIHALHAQWFTLNSGVFYNLRSVFCVSDSIVFVSGELGHVLKTTDGGTTWVQENTPASSQLNSIFFANANVGYAVGVNGAIVKTTDAGINWTLQSSPVTTILKSVFFTSVDTGYAVGPMTLIKTTDGGMNWIRDSTFYPCCALLNDVVFTSPANGFILGYDVPGTMVLETQDTGAHWNAVVDFNATADNYWIARALAVSSTNLPVVAGDQGKIENGWGIWSMYGAPVGNTIINGMCYNHYGSSTFTAVGINGIIGLYPNLGPGTTNQISGVTSSLNSIMFADSLVGYIAGDGGVILKTLNSGYLMSLNDPNISVSTTLSIFPDPLSEQSTIKCGEHLTDGTFTIYNSFGQEVFRIKNISGETFSVNGKSLARGIYFGNLTDNNHLIGTIRFFVGE